MNSGIGNYGKKIPTKITRFTIIIWRHPLSPFVWWHMRTDGFKIFLLDLIADKVNKIYKFRIQVAMI